MTVNDIITRVNTVKAAVSSGNPDKTSKPKLSIGWMTGTARLLAIWNFGWPLLILVYMNSVMQMTCIVEDGQRLPRVQPYVNAWTPTAPSQVQGPE